MSVPVGFAPLVYRYGEAGAREQFERLIAQLARLEAGDASRIEVRRGDGGIDVIAGLLGGQIEVWQAKFFWPAFKTEHRSQVRKSLARAIATAKNSGSSLKRWSLCIPGDLDLRQQAWWNATQASHPSISMRLWSQTALEAELTTPSGRPLKEAYFENISAERGMIFVPPTRVSTADPVEMGIKPAVGDRALPDYVAREADSSIASAIRDEDIVVVIGDSAAGKSRTTYEALHRELPDAVLLAPEASDCGAGLTARLLRLAEPAIDGPVVVWLDDLDEYLTPGGLSLRDVKEMGRRQLKLVATIQLQSCEQILNGGGRAAEVIRMAKVLRLDTKASEPEQRAFHLQHPHASLGEDGIGEHFVAARTIVGRYLTLSDEQRALASMLVDWRRATRRVSMTEQQASQALRQLRGSDKILAPAMSTLVVRRPNGGLTVPDYLVDLDERPVDLGGQGRSLEPRAFSAFVSVAGPAEAAALASRAARLGFSREAEEATRVAMKSSDASVRCFAYSQAGWLSATHDPDAAIDLWKEAMSQPAGEQIIPPAEWLLDIAERTGDLDDHLLDVIEAALVEGAAVTEGRAIRVLARCAAHRGDQDSLGALLERAPGRWKGEVGLVFVRHLDAEGDLQAALAVISEVMDEAAGETLGWLLWHRAEYRSMPYLPSSESAHEDWDDSSSPGWDGFGVGGHAVDEEGAAADARAAVELMWPNIEPLADRLGRTQSYSFEAVRQAFEEQEDALFRRQGGPGTRPSAGEAEAQGERHMEQREWLEAAWSFEQAAELGSSSARERQQVAEAEAERELELMRRLPPGVRPPHVD